MTTTGWSSAPIPCLSLAALLAIPATSPAESGFIVPLAGGEKYRITWASLPRPCGNYMYTIQSNCWIVLPVVVVIHLKPLKPLKLVQVTCKFCYLIGSHSLYFCNRKLKKLVNCCTSTSQLGYWKRSRSDSRRQRLVVYLLMQDPDCLHTGLQSLLVETFCKIN